MQAMKGVCDPMWDSTSSDPVPYCGLEPPTPAVVRVPLIATSIKDGLHRLELSRSGAFREMGKRALTEPVRPPLSIHTAITLTENELQFEAKHFELAGLLDAPHVPGNVYILDSNRNSSTKDLPVLIMLAYIRVYGMPAAFANPEFNHVARAAGLDIHTLIWVITRTHGWDFPHAIYRPGDEKGFNFAMGALKLQWWLENQLGAPTTVNPSDLY